MRGNSRLCTVPKWILFRYNWKNWLNYCHAVHTCTSDADLVKHVQSQHLSFIWISLYQPNLSFWKRWVRHPKRGVQNPHLGWHLPQSLYYEADLVQICQMSVSKYCTWCILSEQDSCSKCCWTVSSSSAQLHINESSVIKRLQLI